MGGTLPKTKTLVFVLASFIVYLAVDLSIGSPSFPLTGDDASGHRALTGRGVAARDGMWRGAAAVASPGLSSPLQHHICPESQSLFCRNFFFFSRSVPWFPRHASKCLSRLSSKSVNGLWSVLGQS
jgi:hypothetical protein